MTPRPQEPPRRVEMPALIGWHEAELPAATPSIGWNLFTLERCGRKGRGGCWDNYTSQQALEYGVCYAWELS